MLPGWCPSVINLYTPHGTSSNTIWHHNTVPRIWVTVSKLTANNTRQNIKAVTALLPQHCHLSTTNHYKTLTHRFPSKTLRYHKNRKQLCSSSVHRNAPSIAFVSDQNGHYISGKWQHGYTHNTSRVVQVLTKRQSRKKELKGSLTLWRHCAMKQCE